MTNEVLSRLTLYEQRHGEATVALAALPEPARRLVTTWLPAVSLWGRCHTHATLAVAAFVADVQSMVAEQQCLIAVLSERVAAQSEILSRLAETLPDNVAGQHVKGSGF